MINLEITELFEVLIKKYSNIEDAQKALREQLTASERLADEYYEWCQAAGYSEKKGFAAFYEEYMEHQDSIWDSIYPNREEYDGYDFLDN